MKKLFFFAIATTIALSSCSENEVFTATENAKTPITIDVYQQGQTRATETTIDILQRNGFDIIAMNGDKELINNKATYADSKWSYGNTIIYWPEDSTNPNVSFYGLYSPNAADALDIANNRATINVDGTSDVVLANVSQSKPTDESPVALSFNHVMSEVVVSAKGKDDGLNYSVTEVTFTVPEIVYYNLTSGNVSRDDLDKELKFLDNAAGVSAPYNATTYTALADANMLILPAHEMTMTIKYKVGATGETPKDFTKTATITPTAGSVNRINVTLPSERTPIAFSISLNGWSATPNNINDPTLQ